MNFKPQIHHRRSIRMKGYDYSLPGAYFITILAYQQKEIFGEVNNGKMILSPLGQIVNDEWFRSNRLRKEIHLHKDELIIMPNHLHGIVWIIKNDPENNNPPESKEIRTEVHKNGEAVNPSRIQRTPHSLSTFISGFKSAVTSRTSRELHLMKIWHSNYYEHVIRNDEEYQKIWDYIDTNPLNWKTDQLQPINK
jgi:putative transposase